MGRSGQSVFHFKQFTLHQDRCGMKVGTDGLLLGAWASAPQVEQVLDIGTGTGLLALMLAQRYPQAQITALELDPEACAQAQENVARSPWANRIQVYSSSLQSWLPGGEDSGVVCSPSEVGLRLAPYDLIVCNPPFYPGQHPQMAQPRRWARECGYLPPELLLAAATQWLTPQGHLAVIYPPAIATRLLAQLPRYRLRCFHHTTVYPQPHQPAKRLLLSIARGECDRVPSDDHRLHSLLPCITIEIQRHQYTVDYCQLMSEFLIGV